MRYGETAVVRLRPRSVLGSFGVMLISCKVNFHVVRSALQNSVCLLSAYEFADRVFYRILLSFAAHSSAVLFSLNVNFALSFLITSQMQEGTVQDIFRRKS